MDSTTEKYVDLSTVDPEMKTNWWHRICVKSFAFYDKIQLQSRCKVIENDVLIHKEFKPTEKFPSVHYFVFLDGEPLRLENRDIKKHLTNMLMDYVKAKNKLPFACEYKETLKNGKVKIDYSPHNFVTFVLDVSAEKLEKYGIEDSEVYFSNLPVETKKNPSRGNALRNI